MLRVYSEFRIPFRQASDESQQTTKSIVLRTIGAALGILGTATGIYFLIYSGLFASATIVGAVAVIVGPPLLFLAIFRGQYTAEEEVQVREENQNSSGSTSDSSVIIVESNEDPFSDNQQIQIEQPTSIIENPQEIPSPNTHPVNVERNSPPVILPNTPSSQETTGVNTQVISLQAEQSNIERLPATLIGEIFSHAGLQELGRGCGISKTMHEKLKKTINQRVWNKALLERYTFGAQKWALYFGNVGTEPPLPQNIIEILNSPCPFFANQRIRDTHMLVLVPATVGGEALTLNKLRQLIQNPRNNGHASNYGFYNQNVQNAHGDTEINQSYWVLMTKDVIPNSRSKTYNQQKELVKQHEGTGYTLPGVLEAAVCILMEHVVSGNSLFSRQPCAYTRCSEIVLGQYPVVVGGFGSVGLVVSFSYGFDVDFYGAACALRKF